MSAAETAIAEAFARGTHLLRAGLCDEALLTFRAVYKRAEAAGATHQMAAALCEIAWSCYRLDDPEQGLASTMRARDLWQRLGDPIEMARVMAVEAILCLDLGLSDDAYDLATEALDIAETAGDPAMLAFALNATGVVLTAGNEAELGAGLLERAVAIADELNNDAAEAYYLLNLGRCHARLADDAEAQSDQTRATVERQAAIGFCDWAVDRAERSGDHWTLRTALRHGAQLLALEGSYAAALGHLDQAAGLPGDPGTSLRIRHLHILAETQFRAGRLEEARVSASQALELADGVNNLAHQVDAAGRLAEILEALDAHTAALALHKRFHALYVRQVEEGADRRLRIAATRAEAERLRHPGRDRPADGWSSTLTESGAFADELQRA